MTYVEPVPRAVSVKDDLVVDWTDRFEISFNNTTNSRYMIVTAGVWLSELVGTPASYTLPSGNYYLNVVGSMPASYRWVDILSTEVRFVPASLHVGNVWSSFGRNQLVVTDSELDYPQVQDLSAAPGVKNFEFDQGFQASYRPAQYAKSCGTPCKLKAGVVGNPTDFQYQP